MTALISYNDEDTLSGEREGKREGGREGGRESGRERGREGGRGEGKKGRGEEEDEHIPGLLSQQ